jgi:hypothetical protein
VVCSDVLLTLRNRLGGEARQLVVEAADVRGKVVAAVAELGEVLRECAFQIG